MQQASSIASQAHQDLMFGKFPLRINMIGSPDRQTVQQRQSAVAELAQARGRRIIGYIMPGCFRTFALP
jgi:hypothetical protein